VSGLWRIGGEVRVFFSFWKICSQSSVHVNRVNFFRSWIIGWVCSASLGRKREMVETANEMLDLLNSSEATHFDDGLAFFRVGLYAALG